MNKISSNLAFAGVVCLLLACGTALQSQEAQPAGPAESSEGESLAVGPWSLPIHGLRGRLVIAKGRLLQEGQGRETVVFIELQNVSQAVNRDLEIRFDPQQLRCKLLDANGEAVRRAGSRGSGAYPLGCRLLLPTDATIRLRITKFGFGVARGGGFQISVLPARGDTWVIRPDDESDYFLSGTFTIDLPADEPRTPQSDLLWHGSLDLPSAKTSAESRR